MIDIEIHIIHPKVSQAGVNHMLNMLLTADTLLNLLRCPRKELCSHNHIVPPGHIPEGTAQILLTGAVLVTDGSIEEIYSLLQAVPDNLPGMLLVQSPAVLSPGGVTESHASHADARDFKISFAKCYVFHIICYP